jgi:sortase system peptidoglycan-associated protein
MIKSTYMLVGTLSLFTLSGAVLAGEGHERRPQEPAGFLSGAAVGGLAAGPFGAVIGAAMGTWIGNRVHRAHDADQSEAEVAALMSDKNDLIESNRTLTGQLEQLSQAVEAARTRTADVGSALNGLQGDVLFRTGSHAIAPEVEKSMQVLAQALAKSPDLKLRLDGYADRRGTIQENLKLSEARANAVRDLLLKAGVREDTLEVNAYGEDEAAADAADADGLALDRRVRLTLRAQGELAVAQVGENE